MSNPSRRLLVTGASGFFGGRLVEAAYLSGFARPVACIRHWSRAARLARFPIEIKVCDILDPASLRPVMKDVDAVVHCAYVDERASIVDGTRNVLQAAQDAGVQKVVFLSTCEVYGPHVSGTIDETASLNYSGRLYSDSKIDAERVCADFIARGMSLTILRPSIVYGPFSRSWTMNMCERLRSGKWKLFEEDGDGTANLVYMDDLVQATFLALTNDRAAGQTYNVNGPDTISWNGYFERLNAELGLPPLERISATRSRLRTRLLDVVGNVKQAIVDRFEEPLWRLYMRQGLASKIMKWIKTELATTPSGRELGQLYSRRAVYTDAKIREQLGYRPRVDVQQGVRLSVQWLQHHGLANGILTEEDRRRGKPEWATPASRGESHEADTRFEQSAVEYPASTV